MVSLYRSILILVATVLHKGRWKEKAFSLLPTSLGTLVAYIEELRHSVAEIHLASSQTVLRDLKKRLRLRHKKKAGLPEGVTRASRTYSGRSDQPATTMFNLPRINFSIESIAESILCRLEGSRRTINLHIYE